LIVIEAASTELRCYGIFMTTGEIVAEVHPRECIFCIELLDDDLIDSGRRLDFTALRPPERQQSEVSTIRHRRVNRCICVVGCDCVMMSFQRMSESTSRAIAGKPTVDCP